MDSFEISYEAVDVSRPSRSFPRMKLAEVTGVLTVPRGFKPSSLIGTKVERLDGRLAGHEATITKAYTLPRRRLGVGKRVKFIAS